MGTRSGFVIKVIFGSSDLVSIFGQEGIKIVSTLFSDLNSLICAELGRGNPIISLLYKSQLYHLYRAGAGKFGSYEVTISMKELKF